MNENLVRRDLQIKFAVLDDEGNLKTKTKTLKNVRFDAVNANLAAYASKYASLVDYMHSETLVADFIQLVAE
ncbi:MAG TPA: hypothetical protein DCY20_01875 [Firmicutes bacterium]|nr:hypothetical protein [Bacillota bacterium]